MICGAQNSNRSISHVSPGLFRRHINLVNFKRADIKRLGVLDGEAFEEEG